MEVEEVEVEEDVVAACNAMVDENGLRELGLSSLASLAVAGKGIPHVSLFKSRLTERPAVDTTAE